MWYLTKGLKTCIVEKTEISTNSAGIKIQHVEEKNYICIHHHAQKKMPCESKTQFETWNVKMLEEHLSSIIKDIGVGKEFLNMSPLDKKINQTINKYNLIKLKNASV